MVKKFKEKITNLWNNFLDNLTVKNIIIFYLWVLGGLAVLALFTYLCKRFITFIVANYELLLLCGSIIGGVVYYIWCKKENHKDAQAVQLRNQMTVEEEREKQQLEDAYRLIQELLYFVINETFVITKIPQLKSVTALEAPTHFVLTNGFYCFQYLVAKDNTTTSNISQMKDVLNNRIRQALNAGEIIGSPQKMYFSDSARPYQKILIHDILDLGSYLQFNTVIVGESYASYIERAKTVSSTPLDNSDLDF